MKYLHKFSTFINESTNPTSVNAPIVNTYPVTQAAEHRPQEETSLTASQLTVVKKLVSALNDKKPDTFDEVESSADGTIIISYSTNVTDWMDLTAQGESIRMWVDERARLRPTFLNLGGLEPEEISRLKDLNLIDNTSNYIELDGEFITGFNILIDLHYGSKDVTFDHFEGDLTSEYFSAEYLDLNDSGPQDYLNIAEEIMDTIHNWLDEAAIRETDLQRLLDERFPEYDDDDDEDDDDENEEDDDDA